MQERDDLEDDFSAPPPPTPAEVARRALVLCGVVVRAAMEDYHNTEGGRATVTEIHDWFDQLALWRHLDEEEEAVVQAPLGKLDHRQHIRSSWYVEGLAILAWALGRGGFPPHDRKVVGTQVVDSLSFLDPSAARLLAGPALRPPAELRAAHEWFYHAHGALRGFLHHSGDGHLPPWIGQSATALGLDVKAVTAGNSLAFAGKPLRASGRAQLVDWESVVCERHRAAIWLVGSDEKYSTVFVDT